MSDNRSENMLYDGDGDRLMERVAADSSDRIVVLPDRPGGRSADPIPKLRVMWGQHLLDDVVGGRYRSLVCAVNAVDNSRGIISQLAQLLPMSQWDEASITSYAQQFATGTARVKVLKFDMDTVEVLALLRPPDRPHLSPNDLESAFRIVTEMITRHPRRWPSASVSFLGARANRLRDSDDREPSFETVLRSMHASGYTGDVYPSPEMWRFGRVGVYSRYPYPNTLDDIRNGGF